MKWAAGASGKWDLALALTPKAYPRTSQMDDILCQTWVDIGKSIENSREGNDAIQNANGDLSSKASSGN